MDANNVVDFGRKLAARRPNAPALQQPLLDVAEAGTSAVAVSHARPSRSPKNQFSGAATLFEIRAVQSVASIQTAAPQAQETPSAASPADAGSRKLTPAAEKPETGPTSPPPANDADAALAQIALRGHSLSAVDRDALLGQLARPAFDALRADAEAAAARTHAFLRAVPERFEGFVRAKMVEIVMQRHGRAQ